MSDCIFCKIVKKDIPSEILYEDEWVLAFKDLNPQAPTHLLFIPKIHTENFIEAIEVPNIYDKIFNAIANLVKEKKWDTNGFRVVSNCGAKAGQSVFHLHFHLLGGRELTWPSG
ncbi:MAG: histidine triad nucleotide-binding protein [Candidatus Cloacimonadota bacterium]|nr:MAG: histidine triad nucleotide-binding protein [Candidatus Cloacimonadota bacterium]